MGDAYDTVLRLSAAPPAPMARRLMLNDFAHELGWRPSDRLLDLPTVSQLAHSHLVVEHGLQDTAVITFLGRDRPFSDLAYADQKRLLGVSYNNLVDWHIHVHPDEVTFVYNRTDPLTVVESARLSRSKLDHLRREAFEQIAGRRPSPNLPSLDNALVDTISFWRRYLCGEMGASASSPALSAMFNAIVLVRAAEDHHRRSAGSLAPAQPRHAVENLVEAWAAPESTNLALPELLRRRLKSITGEAMPGHLVEEQLLAAFAGLSRDVGEAMLHDFYQNKYAPYRYDFSLISKHALSRIYEHYVSVLRLEESPQAPLPIFPPMPAEELEKAYGSVCTPQFIARFFGRYLREQMPPMRFRQVRAVDPACGSGIFLRTLLEMQCDPVHEDVTTESIKQAFGRTLGLDVDRNACEAARLSLSLLHLVLTDRLPSDLNIHAADCMSFVREHPKETGRYDTVLANPPFVSVETQDSVVREAVSRYMRGHADGRVDLYLVLTCISSFYMIDWRHAMGSDADTPDGRRPWDVGVLGASFFDRATARATGADHPGRGWR